MRRFFVIGGGLAGLAAAVTVADRHPVRLFEAAGFLGGRCRSFHDEILGITIDNGNHLILNGNDALSSYMDRIDSQSRMVTADDARYEFFDAQTDHSFTLDFGKGRHPFGFLKSTAIPPFVKWQDYALSLWRMMRADKNKVVADCCGGKGHPLYDNFWNMLSLAILNTDGEEASARSLWRVMRTLMGKGGDGMRPCLPATHLSHGLIEPAEAFLKRNGARIQNHCVIKSLAFDKDHVCALMTKDNETIAIGRDDRVIMAVPEYVLSSLLPDIAVPLEYRPIFNVHFGATKRSHVGRMVGVLNGLSHWIFVRPSSLAVTISAARHEVMDKQRDIIPLIWDEVCRCLSLGHGVVVPPYRCVIEKRATFAHTSMQESCRPPQVTSWRNLFLAGNWTQTGMPATLEGAVRSGQLAIKVALG